MLQRGWVHFFGLSCFGLRCGLVRDVICKPLVRTGVASAPSCHALPAHLAEPRFNLSSPSRPHHEEGWGEVMMRAGRWGELA